MVELVRFSDVTSLYEEAARRWVSIAVESVEARGRMTVALSGGSTPRALYELLATPEWREQVPWDKVYFFWGDERRVSSTDPDSNFRMVSEALLDHVPVDPGHVFPINGTELAKSAQRAYTYTIEKQFGLARREFPRFDLMLAGLGADAHFASIYPGTRAASDLSNMVLVYPVHQLGVERVTLTIPVFNNARHVMFLVTGEEKAQALANTLESEHRSSTYPAQSVILAEGTVTWLVDEAAASKLTKDA